MELSLVDITPAPEKGGQMPKAGGDLALPQEIELVAFGTSRAPIARPPVDGAAHLAAAPDDSFMAEALREYKDGNIDLPLWSRAIGQHEGDQPQAVAVYLRARATVLKLEHRQRRSADPQLPVRAAVPVVPAMPVHAAQKADDDAVAMAEARLRSRTKRKYVVIATSVVAALVIGAWWMMASVKDSAQASHPADVSGAALTVPVTPHVVRANKEDDPNTYFADKILDLKSAGNWNVLVLFASEWTRKQPGNAMAWKELSLGYSNMRQFNDAFEAGTKATQLAPTDPLVWRNLAQVNLDLKEPEAALKAYERAAALNDLDVVSVLQVGALATALDRLPQARAAYERVLAVDPDNPDALCGTAAIAQRQGRAKDVDAISRQLRGAERKCRDVPGAVTVAARK